MSSVGDVTSPTLVSGQAAIVVYLRDGSDPSEHAKNYAEVLRGQAGKVDAVQLQPLSQLSNLPQSSFDVVCVFDPIPVDRVVYDKFLHVLKPNGSLWLKEVGIVSSTGPDAALNRIRSDLTLNGFVRPTVQTSSLPIDSEVRDQLKSPFDCSSSLTIVTAIAFKPSYEVGDCAPIKLLKKTADVAKAWTLDTNDMLDDDILDSDAILDADDLKKPDPAMLRATCGVTSEGTAKRKACKNCTCGLAEELEAEDAMARAAEPRASSCGSCYLGDAFRCSSCPYRGMPAFKPGEVVQLPAMSLQDDV